MNTIQKFSLSFCLALALHFTILAMFAMGFSSEDEIVKQKPLPEIIQASMLDDEKIMEEAHRLKTNETNKKIAQQKQQQDIENKRKKEQHLLHKAKKKRLQEEKKAKELEKVHKAQALKETQKLDAIKKEKALEAARLSKIKQQKAAETKRLDDMRKAEKKRLEDLRIAKEKKRESERQAEQKRKAALVAKQKTEAAQKAAQLKKQAEAKAAQLKAQAAAAKAKKRRDRKATISSTAAIQRKVNQRWIKPLSSGKGLSCTIRVKLLPSGDVMEAAVVRGSGDTIFDRSAENAVRKASPLPVPKDRDLFARQFRVFTFEFKPE
ncbi:MAG: cell envelope integrity protein TolA [Methylococcaceae bacterium]